MKKILKLAGCALMLSGYCASEVAANCPVLTQPDLRRLCRWEGFKILGIKAGTVTVDGTILTNRLGTCGEGDSIKQFVTKKVTTTYPGVLTKDFAEPTNPLKGLCTYSIGGEKIAFDVQLPPKPAKPAEPVEPRALPATPLKKPKTFGGVDITMSPEIRQVPLVRPTVPTAPASQLAQPTKPPPTTGVRPVPPMPREAPPVPPTREASDDENSPPSYPAPHAPSKPPQRPAPDVPSRGTQQAAPGAAEEKPMDMKSNQEQNLKKRQAVYGAPPLRHPPEPTYGAG